MTLQQDLPWFGNLECLIAGAYSYVDILEHLHWGARHAGVFIDNHRINDNPTNKAHLKIILDLYMKHFDLRQLDIRSGILGELQAIVTRMANFFPEMKLS